MFHLAAYTGLVGTVPNTPVPALQDDVLIIQNNRFLFQEDTPLLASYAASTTLTRARFISPSLRIIGAPNIRPITRAVGGVNDPNVMDLRAKPIIIPGLEEFGLDASTGLAMGTEQVTALIFVGEQPEPLPAGDPITIRFTSATAAVANTWTTVVATPDDSIGEGAYAIVGSEHFSATGIAHRYILNNDVRRPGGLSVAGIDRRGPLLSYPGEMGVWGRFRTTALPRFQVLCGAADVTHEFFLTIQRLYTLS